jgi:hypothetical protein
MTAAGGGAAGGFVAALVGRTPDLAPPGQPIHETHRGPESSPHADASADTAAPHGWRLAIAAGVFPYLLLGFAASALANRLAFAGWGLAAAVGHLLLLRVAWSRGWSVVARLALLLAWGAGATFAFAALVERHGEILDLGYRALLWSVYTPVLTGPASWRGLGGGLAIAAAVATLLARLAKRRKP